MTFDEFYDQYSDFVVQRCFEELLADQVEPVSTAIIERAFEWVQEGRPADWSILWALSIGLDEHRSPERRAELDAEFTAAMAACAI